MHELYGRRKRGLSPAKAKQMLKDNSAQGHPLTGPQKGYFGMIAGGRTPMQAHEATAPKRRRRRGKS